MTLTEACAIALVAAATFGYRILTFTQFPNDHFVHLAAGQQIAGGAWPVRDFVERGTPLMEFVSAAGQRWGGAGLRSELVIVASAFALAAALCVFVFARLSGSLAAGTALALTPTLIYPLPYGYPKLLVYAAAFAATWAYLRLPTLRRRVLLGVVLAIAFLFRHDHGLLLGVAAAAALLAHHGLRPGLPALGQVAAVAAVACAPFLIWVQIHTGVWTYLVDGAEFSRRESERATWAPPVFGLDREKPLWRRMRRGPVVNVRWNADASAAAVRDAERRHRLTRLDSAGPRSWQYELAEWTPEAVERLVRDPAAEDTHHIDRSTYALQVPVPEGLGRLLVRLQVPAEGLRLRDNTVTALYYAVWLLPALALGAVILLRRIVEREVGALVVMAVVTQFAVNITMLRDPLANRIRDVIVPAAAVTAALIGVLWLRGRGRGGVLHLGARAIAVVLLAAFVVAAGVIGEATPRTSELLADGWGGIQRRARSVGYRLSPPQHRTGGELNEAYLRLVNYIRRCTPERSRLLTLAFVPELFIYTGREFAGGHMAFTEGYYVGERHESLALQRLRAEDVPLVILDAEIRKEMAASHPRIWEYVMQRYRPAGEFPIRPGRTMAVLAETSRPVRGRFEGSTLPCFQANI